MRLKLQPHFWVFWLCIFCTINSTIGQSLPSEKTKQYYKTINNAELLIVEKKYSEAKDLYGEAFKLKYPNDKDLYNAFLVSYYSKDAVQATRYLNQLAYQGMNKGMFQDSLFDPALYHQVFVQFDSARNAGEMSFGSPMWPVIIAGIQKFERSNEMVDNQGNVITDRNIIDSLNDLKLIESIDRYGFPSFEKIGFRGQPFSINLDWFLFKRTRGSSTSFAKNEIKKRIYEAVLLGNYRPDNYAAIIIMDSSYLQPQNILGMINKKDGTSKEEQLIQINKNREKLMLESYADYETKEAFVNENKRRARAEFNPNLYAPNESIREQFIFFSDLYTPNLLNLGHFPLKD